MRKNVPGIVLLFIIFAIQTNCYSQNNSWLDGTWKGKVYLPGSKTIQDFTIILKIYRTSENHFDGVLQTILPIDTIVHRDLKITGTVYNKFLVMKPVEVLYEKNPHGNLKWENGCDTCSPPNMAFSIEKGKVFFRGEVKGCLKTCNGIREFSRDLSEFDSTTRDSLYAIIDGIHKKPRLLQDSISSVSQKIAASFKDADIAMTQQSNAVLVSQKTTTTLLDGLGVSIPVNNTSLISERIAATSKDARVILLPGKKILQVPQNEKVSLTRQPSLQISKKKPPVNIVYPDNTALSKKIAASSKSVAVVAVPQKKLIPVSQKANVSMKRNPGYLIPLSNPTPVVVKQSAPSKNDTITSLAKNTASAIPLKTTVGMTSTVAVALPTDYSERKKNVIKTLEVNTDSVILRVYDNGIVDGDIVSIIYNDQVVIDKLSLTSRAVVTKIGINKSGINTLVFHAHNLGEYPPNTAKLEIIYGKKEEDLTVSSDLAVSSTIDLIYKN